MPERTKWISAKIPGYSPIYTSHIGTDDPCDSWPLHHYAGVVYITTYDRVSHPHHGWLAQSKPFA